MDETREAVARAIYEGRNGRGCVPWSRQTDSHRQPYRADADAALRCLLVRDFPGRAMLRACEEK